MSQTDERVFLCAADAVAMLPDGEDIHTFRQSGPMLLGADWPRERLIQAIKDASKIELAGPMATKVGYGLVIHDETGPLFIAIRKEPSA